MAAANYENLLFKCREVGIASSRASVVSEWKASRGVGCGPTREEGIQQSLVATIEAALLNSKLGKFAESFRTWLEDKDTRVEAIWPANIWGSGQFLTFE